MSRDITQWAGGIRTSRTPRREINKFIKNTGAQGRPSQTQGDQVTRVGQEADDLQAVIAPPKGEDFGIPLQFKNFRD